MGAAEDASKVLSNEDKVERVEEVEDDDEQEDERGCIQRRRRRQRRRQQRRLHTLQFHHSKHCQFGRFPPCKNASIST